MPRALRIEYPGAIYHVVNRGDRRDPIFRDEADYQCFLATLADEACAKTDWLALRMIFSCSGSPRFRRWIKLRLDS